MNNNRFESMVEIMNNICNQINKKENNNIEYVVLQGLSKKDPYILDPFIIYKIADFYNYNWLGNADFMHIPNFSQVVFNCNNYPIIIAREKNTKDIIGISTLKYDENSSELEDPYYPIKSEKYFSITGILTKINNQYKGIGKKIYEIAIKSHYYYNKIYNDTTIMCVIDCRNKNSVNALSSAAESLNKEVEENIIAKITGYYLLLDEEEQMIEAPTIVLKVEETKEKQHERNIVEYRNSEESLFNSLLNTLEEELTDIRGPIINNDEGNGTVHYYHVENYNSLPKIISNGTEHGNDRVVRENTPVAALCKVKTFDRRRDIYYEN